MLQSSDKACVQGGPLCVRVTTTVPYNENLTRGCWKGLVYFLLEELFPLPFPDGFPVLLGAFRGLPLLFPPLLFPLPPFFAMLVD